MKSSDFFIEKAKQYVSEFDSIISDSIEFDINSPLAFSSRTPYAIQQISISELKLKTKLLFSEFDNGEFFVQRLNEIESDIRTSLDGDERLKSYVSTLELFIDHINQFRN